jgi:hypothetical protein
MSTRNLRRIIQQMQGMTLSGDQSRACREALSEVEAIEKAAREFYLNGDDANCETAWALMDTIGADVVAKESDT